MKKLILLIVVLLLSSTSIFSQVKSIIFFDNGLGKESYYLWTWGFADEPKIVDDIGYNPGTSAIEARFKKTVDGWDSFWTSYGVYIGDEYFNIDEIVPDSLYFKLRAPEGVGESDRLVIWLYDDNNSTWEYALFYELDDFQLLQDKEWHQFSVSLYDFFESTYTIDYSKIKAVSFERPAEDEDSEFPILYIDQVWIGLPEDVSAIPVKETTKLPSKIELAQNYPNPFNPVTFIEFSIPKTTNVRLSIFDLQGKEVIVLINENRDAGNYSIEFNGSNLSSGIYFYKLEAGNKVLTKKLTLIK